MDRWYPGESWQRRTWSDTKGSVGRAGDEGIRSVADEV
jgi:hypothetical protein